MKLRAAALLLIAASTGSPGLVVATAAQGADLIPVEVWSVGVDPRTGAPVVLLQGTKTEDVVPIWIGEAEARAIALALQGVEVPRPQTHDLITSLLSELHATVVEVRVHAVMDTTYLGTIRLQPSGGEIREVDSRPSDALAIALRVKAPIRVARTILDESPDFDFVAVEGADPMVRLRGITVVMPSDAERRTHALDNRAGVLVTHVAGDARRQGMRPGDLLVSVNGRAVRRPLDYYEAVRTASTERILRLGVVRAGQEREINLPPPAGSPATPKTSEERFKV